MNELRLRRKADRRIRRGHVWIYSNEVDVDKTPLRGFSPGEQVLVTTSSGKLLGTAFVNPAALICARLIARGDRRVMDRALLCERLERALALRARLFAEPCYRLAFGDSDALPGLVVDRFFDVCVVQIATAGMENLRAEIIDALAEVIRPSAIVLKNDSGARAIEGLPSYVDCVAGSVGETVSLRENDVPFVAPLMEGQKTGWFYDHRVNRRNLAPYVPGARVLDLFSYVGGWGIQAAVHGAGFVTCVDSSSLAMAWLRENARINAVEASVRCIEGDAFAVTRELRGAGEQFDVIVIDPPAFIPRRKDMAAGEVAYQRINQAAIELLAEGGVLVSSSCSMHLDGVRFLDLLRGCANHAGRFAQLVERGHQGPDHPILPAVPETDYLKTLTLRMLPL